MKKLFIIIATLAFMVSNSNAQDNETSESPQFGFKIGANLANVYDTDGDQFKADAKLGLAAGAFLSIPLGRIFGIQPEILYSQKGYQSSGSIIEFDYKYTHTSNFIDVPLLVAFKPIPFLTILAGPQYSFLLSEKNEFTNTVFSDPLIQEHNFNNDNVRKNILGFVIGGDINVGKVVISARAGWDILNNNGDGTQTIPRYKNVYYQGTLGYRF